MQVRNALSRLLDSRTASVKSGSAVTLAKLSTSAKGSDPMNEGDLVRSVYGLVTSAAERLKAGESGAAEVAARAVEALRCAWRCMRCAVLCCVCVPVGCVCVCLWALCVDIV